MSNKELGDRYEIYIQQKLVKNSEAYLWKDIPEKHLISAGLVSNFNDIRLMRNRGENLAT